MTNLELLKEGIMWGLLFGFMTGFLGLGLYAINRIWRSIAG